MSVFSSESEFVDDHKRNLLDTFHHGKTDSDFALDQDLGLIASFIPPEDRREIKKSINIRKKTDDLEFAGAFRNEDGPDRNRLASISGPMDRHGRKKYVIALATMIICGSSNDFLGKLIYQMLPGDDSGLKGLSNDLWASVLLTAGAFFICSFALFTPGARESIKDLDRASFTKIMIPAVMDLLVTGGRYLGLVFLPAAIVSIMKNGLQLVFLAVIRWLRGKFFSKWQWLGLLIVVIGLLIVSVQDVYQSMIENTDSDENLQTDKKSESLAQSVIGVLLMTVVAFMGAIRNVVEEILVKPSKPDSKAYHPNLIVGLESIISLACIVVVSFVAMSIRPQDSWGDAPEALKKAFSIIGIPIAAVCFLAAIYGKDTNQMKVTKLSSSMTRKLWQQVYPSGTWIMSLIAFYSVPGDKYGEKWDLVFSFVCLIGFILVFVGTYLYMKPPKLQKSDLIEYERSPVVAPRTAPAGNLGDPRLVSLN